MKLQTFLFVLVATLTCRAENAASPAAVPAAQKAEAAKPAQVAATPAKPADVVPQATPAVEAPKALAPEKADLMSSMAPVVVKGTSDLKPLAMDLKMDLADSLTGKHAAIAQQLADDAQAQKAAFAHFLAIDQPALSAPQLPTIAAPAVALGQPKKP